MCHFKASFCALALITNDLEFEKDEKTKRLNDRLCFICSCSKTYKSFILVPRIPKAKLLFNEGSCRRQFSSVKMTKVFNYFVNLVIDTKLYLKVGTYKTS